MASAAAEATTTSPPPFRDGRARRPEPKDMHRFFCPDIPPCGETGRLDASESRHAFRVLRVREGENAELVDGEGLWALACVTGFANAPRRPVLQFRVRRRAAVPPSDPQIRLCVAPPRPKPMAQIVQQATELGVGRITPLICEFGVSRPDGSPPRRHWRNEAVSALKQSGNPRLPVLDDPAEMSAILAECRGNAGVFGDSDASHAALPSLPSEGTVSLWVGPEGGFSPEERTALLEAGVRPVRIGRNTLRVETAVVGLVAWILAEAEANR